MRSCYSIAIVVALFFAHGYGLYSLANNKNSEAITIRGNGKRGSKSTHYLSFHNFTNVDKLADTLAQHVNITHLTLEDGQLGHLGDQNWPILPFLTTLDISRVRFEEINIKWLSQLPSLTALTVTNCRLQRIPSSQYQILPRLKFLNLSHNQIKRILCHDLRSYPGLLQLNLDFNTIFDIGSDNCSRSLFPSALRRLSLAENSFQEISIYAFDGLHQLVSLDISSNKLQTFRQGTFESLPALKWLNFANQKIKNNQAFHYNPKIFKPFNRNTDLNVTIHHIAQCNYCDLLLQLQNWLIGVHHQYQILNYRKIQCHSSSIIYPNRLIVSLDDLNRTCSTDDNNTPSVNNRGENCWSLIFFFVGIIFIAMVIIICVLVYDRFLRQRSLRKCSNSSCSSNFAARTSSQDATNSNTPSLTNSSENLRRCQSLNTDGYMDAASSVNSCHINETIDLRNMPKKFHLSDDIHSKLQALGVNNPQMVINELFKLRQQDSEMFINEQTQSMNNKTYKKSNQHNGSNINLKDDDESDLSNVDMETKDPDAVVEPHDKRGSLPYDCLHRMVIEQDRDSDCENNLQGETNTMSNQLAVMNTESNQKELAEKGESDNNTTLLKISPVEMEDTEGCPSLKFTTVSKEQAYGQVENTVQKIPVMKV
ncbi:Leucine-rich repeat-containing G-protein coupled receptor 6 [Trichoplax sp. H2]|nr:Leucine-rich repeat-containing G-protein coupled receptor 6 [Trichoplax sp. H2]|eukprot:RDD41554.1 Leucine-rich repeat-containing G-protein coupled receptor 6 [Trichoplax sp. H2]